MTDMMQIDLKISTECLSAVNAAVEPVNGSKRLLYIKQAVDPSLLMALNDIDWGQLPWLPETADRFVLEDGSDTPVQRAIDQQIQCLLPEINRLTGQHYTFAGSCWMLCKPDYVSVMHTDGHKPNLLLIYWQVPGPQFGTTFYNSCDYLDVRHEFSGLPNTGFFANYETDPGDPWPDMWHASPVPVPPGTHRLISQYQLQR